VRELEDELRDRDGERERRQRQVDAREPKPNATRKASGSVAIRFVPWSWDMIAVV
jgi:hypothetical protein